MAGKGGCRGSWTGASTAVGCSTQGVVAKGEGSNALDRIQHIVVIYQENHSFDNLFGGWEGVDWLARADVAHTTQVDQAGHSYAYLPQLDANLTSPPLPTDCTDTTHTIISHFGNRPFTIDEFIPATAKTCPEPQKAFASPNAILASQGLPGGCTRDLVHEFYPEQYQLNGGAQNRYVTGSNSAGTTMGVYDTKRLPIYTYMHQQKHPAYAIADNFFQGAFGGSFLNHQWLIAAATPVFPKAPPALHSIIDANGMPVGYPFTYRRRAP